MHRVLGLLQNEANFLWLHEGTSPVVEVVLKVAIPNAELELLQELGVLHQVQGVEHVKVCLYDKRNVLFNFSKFIVRIV